MSSYLTPVLAGIVWALVQFLAALPWLAALDSRGFRSAVRQPKTIASALGVVLAAGLGLAFFTSVAVQDASKLLAWGKIYGAILHLQLTADFFVLFFPALTLVWPKGAAVALAAFREGIRQPMFWVVGGLALGLMVFSPFLPYFTFGEDHKMVLDLGYGMIMLACVLFSLLASSMSISEEIEGRTAITVMSKPVSRRQFLLGKYIGILCASLFMTGGLGVVFNGVMWFTLWFNKEPLGDPNWVELARRSSYEFLTEPIINFSLGAGAWFQLAFDRMPGLVLGFCQGTVLLAISVALATRLPMVVNVVSCVVIFFLGHLTHVLVHTSMVGRFKLVSFIAKVFDNILPGLEYFNPSPIVVRDIPPDPNGYGFAIYLGSVVLYAVLYSVIALLLGLILFEDRDLA